MTEEMMGLWADSGISWTICKQSAPCSREITDHTNTSSLPFFTGWMLFLMLNQQCKSTEGMVYFFLIFTQCYIIRLHHYAKHKMPPIVTDVAWSVYV